MSKGEKQVSVYLTGENLERFKIMKQRWYMSSDAEVLRACLKFAVENYDVIEALRRLGVDPTMSVEQIQAELDAIKQKLAELEG